MIKEIVYKSRLFLFFSPKKRQTLHLVCVKIIPGEEMTVYLDIVFLENIIINYIILYATGIISKAKVRQIRLVLGAIIRCYIFSNILYIQTKNIFKFHIKNHFINCNNLYIF